jgi:hypothetical protein
VVALYPREAFWSDHPYAILDLPSVTASSARARGFRAFLLGRSASARPDASARPVDPGIALGAPRRRTGSIRPAKNVLPNRRSR